MTPKPPTQESRFAHMEASIASVATQASAANTSIANVATQLGDFIKDSKEHRERVERDQQMLWAAIKEQGVALQTSVEKLSNRGQITWPIIVSTVALLVTLIATGAGVGHMLMESRIKQVEIRQEFLTRDADRSYAEKAARISPPQPHNTQ
jgi:membrane protein YqaA with SNARE-associated domain